MSTRRHSTVGMVNTLPALAGANGLAPATWRGRGVWCTTSGPTRHGGEAAAGGPRGGFDGPWPPPPSPPPPSRWSAGSAGSPPRRPGRRAPGSFWSAPTTGTPGSTRRSRRRSTRPSPVTGSWSPPATTTRTTTPRARARPRPRRGTTAGWSSPPPICTSGAWTATPWWSTAPRPVRRRAPRQRRTRTSGPTAPGATASSSTRRTTCGSQNLTVCNFLAGPRVVGQRGLVERRCRLPARSGCTATGAAT